MYTETVAGRAEPVAGVMTKSKIREAVCGAMGPFLVENAEHRNGLLISISMYSLALRRTIFSLHQVLF